LLERHYDRKRFKDLLFFARGGKTFDERFAAEYRENVKNWQRQGYAQVQVIALGDNDLREGIDQEHAQGGFETAERISQFIKDLVAFSSSVPDVYMIILSPLPSPKYHRYTDVFKACNISK